MDGGRRGVRRRAVVPALKLIVMANFAVMVRDGTDANGRPIETRKRYTRGMVLDPSKIPEGQSVEDWLGKGHVKAA